MKKILFISIIFFFILPISGQEVYRIKKIDTLNSSGSVYRISNDVVYNLFSFASTDGSVNQDWLIRLPEDKSILIYWGDGTSDNYSGLGIGTNVNASHTYSKTGNYKIKLSGDYLDLTFINCSNNNLTGEISSLSILINLTIINCSNNNLTGEISSLFGLVNLTYLSCYNNNIIGDASGLSSLVNLTFLNCSYNNLSFDNITTWEPLDLGSNCNFRNNGMTSGMVDNALISFASGSLINTTITFIGNSPRTSASDEAVTTLESNGCTILTD